MHRDISILYHAYHLDARKMDKMLDKYELKEEGDNARTADDVNPKLGVPPFLLDPTFDARRDIPRFDFQDPNRLSYKIREKMIQPAVQKKIQRYNQYFDIACVLNFIVYLFVMYNLCVGAMSMWVTVPAMVVLRTACGAFGHYYVHRSKPNWAEAFFDSNYVGTSLIGEDGHVLLHHPYTQSGGDVKRTFFTGMLSLPVFLRIPGYTLHKMGVLFSGIIIRGVEVNFMENKQPVRWCFWFMRILISAEVCLAVYHQQYLAFFLQYFFTLWFNTILIVSSHDFEEEHPSDQSKLPAEHKADWGVLQLENCFDFTLCGNRWIDLFLSAGLSPHRAHHLLPYQKSGFANLVSEDVIRETVLDFGLEWKPVRNFWTERFFQVLNHYLFYPPINPRTGRKKEYSQWGSRSMMDAFTFMFLGWLGIGAV